MSAVPFRSFRSYLPPVARHAGVRHIAPSFPLGTASQTSEVDVKAKRRFTEGARAAWATEKRGQYWADVYYDCDEETERYLDEGKEIPFFKDWFMERVEFADLNNLPFFLGIDVKGALTPVELAVAKDTLVKERGVFPMKRRKPRRLPMGEKCKDEDYLGRYKGHPIVWILDNVYAGGGGKLAMKVPAGAKTKKKTMFHFLFFWMRRSLCILQKTRVRRHLTIILLCRGGGHRIRVFAWGINS